jgi:hypothetical protein
MKTKKVIEILQKLDPAGENEVSVCGRDIVEITMYPAYYDGALEVLERDETKSDVPEFQIVKGRMIRSGVKIVINPMSIEEALLDNPEMPVEVENPTEWRMMLIERWREEGRRIQKEANKTPTAANDGTYENP